MLDGNDRSKAYYKAMMAQRAGSPNDPERVTQWGIAEEDLEEARQWWRDGWKWAEENPGVPFNPDYEIG